MGVRRKAGVKSGGRRIRKRSATDWFAFAPAMGRRFRTARFCAAFAESAANNAAATSMVADLRLTAISMGLGVGHYTPGRRRRRGADRSADGPIKRPSGRSTESTGPSGPSVKFGTRESPNRRWRDQKRVLAENPGFGRRFLVHPGNIRERSFRPLTRRPGFARIRTGEWSRKGLSTCGIGDAGASHYPHRGETVLPGRNERCVFG